MERRPLAEEVIEALDIKKGMKILDFGCGGGRYSLPIAKFLGKGSKVYALDKEKDELKKISDEIERLKLENIVLICSDGNIPLMEERVDMVLLFDVLHIGNNKNGLLEKCCKVLKPEGIIAIFPHTHIPGSEIINMVNQTNLCIFKNAHEKLGLYIFKKKGTQSLK